MQHLTRKQIELFTSADHCPNCLETERAYKNLQKVCADLGRMADALYSQLMEAGITPKFSRAALTVAPKKPAKAA